MIAAPSHGSLAARRRASWWRGAPRWSPKTAGHPVVYPWRFPADVEGDSGIGERGPREVSNSSAPTGKSPLAVSIIGKDGSDFDIRFS